MKWHFPSLHGLQSTYFENGCYTRRVIQLPEVEDELFVLECLRAEGVEVVGLEHLKTIQDCLINNF